MVTPPCYVNILRPDGTAGKRIAVIEQFGNRRVRSAERAVGIAFHFDFSELRLACIEIQESIRERMADTQNEFQGLSRLDRSNDAG